MRPPVVALYHACRACCHGYLRLFHRFRVFGLEHVPADGACILASNHASYLDPPILGSPIRHRVVHFMARDTLFRGPLAWLLPRLGTVPLDRGRGDVSALRSALAILRHDCALGLFPEGTRTRTGAMQPAKGGVGFLVAKASVPVIPVYIDGSFKAWPKGARRPRLHAITIVYGDPISPAQIAAHGTTHEAYEQISALVMARIAALRPAR